LGTGTIAPETMDHESNARSASPKLILSRSLQQNLFAFVQNGVSGAKDLENRPSTEDRISDRLSRRRIGRPVFHPSRGHSGGRAEMHPAERIVMMMAVSLIVKAIILCAVDWNSGPHILRPCE
jgi:hypothetical protein